MGSDLSRFFRRGRSVLTAAVRRSSAQLSRVGWVREPLRVEELEPRTVPTLTLAGPVTPAPLPFPPLVPDPGDQSILDNILKQSTGSNRKVLDSLPDPFVIADSAGGIPTQLTDGHSHAPVKIDADNSKATGKGGSGFDLQIEVDTFVSPVPHLTLTIDRLGDGPFATNLSVVLAIPWAGFDLEPGLPATPNLVVGFQTRGSGDTPGGYVPLHEVITLTPGTLAGTSHSFTATMSTTGADNPLRFIFGNLDGTNLTGTLNEAGVQAYVENVPATITTTVTTVESGLNKPINSSFNLNWQASSASPVKLDYLESVGPPTATPDFNTSMVVNQMPTNEQFALAVNEPGGQMTLSQQGNAPINSMTFQKTRSDGLAVVGNGGNVPIQLSVAMNLDGTPNAAGTPTLADNANVGSFAVQASKTGGFASSSGFLGYNVGTIGMAVTNAPTLSAGYSRSGTDRVFSAAPATAGNVIGSLEYLVSSNSPANAQLPGVTCGMGSWSNPAWDVLSMIDTGTGDTSVPAVYPPGATAAARLLNFKSVRYIQHANWPTIGNFLDLVTTTATPLKIYLRTTPTSVLIPGHDIEITEEIQNVPAGEFMFTFNGPTNFHYSTNPLTGIGSVDLCGHIDTLAFDIDAADLPAIFALDWDPDSHLAITSQSSPGVEAFLGHVAGTLSDSNGITLPGYSDVGALFGTKLKEAWMRIDHAPSITATWVATDGSGNTSVQFKTAALGLFAGGIQFASSTNLTDPALGSGPTPANSLTADYATFNDKGPGMGLQDMLVGILGLDSFSYTVVNGSDFAHMVWDDNQPVPFNLNVNSAQGGKYFVGNKVLLTDNVGLVPTHLDYQTNLDYRQVLTGTNFIPFIDLTFDKNEGLPAGTTLHVHADTLPAVTVFDYEPAAGTFSILAQDLAFHDTQKFGDVLLDLECPDGLPGTDSVLGAKVKQAIMRLDNVPSFTGTYASTAAGTTIGLMSVAPGLSIGAVQVEISTAQDLPPLGPPTGSGDVDTVTLSDPGGSSAKHLVAQLFGLTNFTYSTSNASNSSTIVITQDAARKMIATVVSNNGKFFSPHNVDVAVTINQLPTSITLTTDGKSSLTYTASSGIGSITVGGHGGAAEGFFDTTKFSLSATGLPSSLTFSLNPAASVALTVNANVGNITAHLHDPNGLGGGNVLLGDAVRDIRLQLDSVPSLTGTWSGGGSTSVNFDATTPGTFLGGAQVALSSQENDTIPAFVAGPGSSTADYVKVDDEGSGKVKRVAAGLFGIGHFALSTQDGAHGLTIGYASNGNHELKVNVDSNFGHFFSSYNIRAVLDVQTVPQTWNFSSDFATALNYTASSGISQITATADIDKTMNSADNTHAEFTITGLPASVDFALDPNNSATLTMSAALTEIKLLVQSDNGILGMSNYKLVTADLNNIPASWSANWSGGQFVVQASAAMGTISGLVSTSDDPTTNANTIAPFMDPGPTQDGAVLGGTSGGSRIDYSTFTQEVDARYYNASGAPSVFSRLQELYANSKVLSAGEDHALAVISGGNLQLAEFQFTGFQTVKYQPNANGGHYELDVPNHGPSPHTFFAGAMLDSQGLALQIGNIPGTLTLDIDTSADNIHFHSDVSAGQIDAYYGPLPIAHDGDTAVRAVMDNTPSDVQITWTFGFPNGNAKFQASNPFSLSFLAQSGGTRVIGGLQLMNLELSYGLNFPELNVHIDLDLDPLNLHASVDLDIAHFGVQIDNSTNGTEDTTPGHGVSGFLELYEHRSVSDLQPDAQGDPAFPAPGGDQFVPQLTFMMKDFTLFQFGIDAGVELFPDLLSPEVHLDPDPTVLHGQFVIDYWLNAGVDYTTGDIDLGPFGDYDFGLQILPSYQYNAPIFVVPFESLGVSILHDEVFTFTGFGDFSDHFDPFSGMMLAAAVGGGASGSALLTDSSLGPALDEAASLWLAAGIDPARLGAALDGARVVIADLPGRHLGLTDPLTRTIWIDRDAAGYRWSTDPNPADAPAAGRMDLLTVVTHEMGHLLGYDDVQDPRSIMSEVLQPGERLTPAPQPGSANVPAGTSADATPALQPGSADVPAGTSAAATPALPLSFAGVPLVPGRFLDGPVAALIVMLSALPAARQVPAPLNDPQRAAVLDAVYARSGDAPVAGPLSDRLAPSYVLGIAELHPPDGGALDIAALAADTTDVAWQLD